MDTFIKAKTTLRYVYWRDRILTFLLFSFLLWTAVIAISSLAFNQEVSPAKSVAVEHPTSQPVTRQQLAERYRDPSLTYFFGK